MKVFAFLLANLFIFQTTVPALCMTSCVLESVANSSCCLIEETDDCCVTEKAACEFVEEQSCCEAEEMSVCVISQEDGITADTKSTLPCNDCNVPCCSAPLCCFYFQGITEIKFSISPVLITGQLPSNNGTPNQGYLGDCFQPPEII